MPSAHPGWTSTRAPDEIRPLAHLVRTGAEHHDDLVETGSEHRPQWPLDQRPSRRPARAA